MVSPVARTRAIGTSEQAAGCGGPGFFPAGCALGVSGGGFRFRGATLAFLAARAFIMKSGTVSAHDSRLFLVRPDPKPGMRGVPQTFRRGLTLGCRTRSYRGPGKRPPRIARRPERPTAPPARPAATAGARSRALAPASPGASATRAARASSTGF